MLSLTRDTNFLLLSAQVKVPVNVCYRRVTQNNFCYQMLSVIGRLGPNGSRQSTMLLHFGLTEAIYEKNIVLFLRFCLVLSFLGILQ